MRFEAKRNFLKRSVKNFKNITKSLVKQHHRQLAYHWENLNVQRFKFGPVRKEMIDSLEGGEALSAVATDHTTAVSSRGGERRGYGFIVIRKLSYRAYTLRHLAPQSVPFADLYTLGPVIVCGVRFRLSVTASCEGTGYMKEKSSGYK